MITKDTQLSRLHVGAAVTVLIRTTTEYRTFPPGAPGGSVEYTDVEVNEATGRLQAYGQDGEFSWIALGNDTRVSPTLKYLTNRTVIEVTAEYADI